MSDGSDSCSPAKPGIVLSVGQCGFDNGQIRELLRTVDPALEIRFVDDLEETLRLLHAGNGRIRLVLVNRILDADGSSGIELIRTIRANPEAFDHIPLMLVSDLETAQAAAIASGALPGFGKTFIRSAQARELVRMALESVR